MRKVTAVSEQDARRRLVPSMTTLAALINHLTSVELKWFGHHLGQRPLRDLGLEDGEEASWRVGPQENVDGLIARYEQVCGLSRQTAAHFTLDDVVPHPQLDRVSLRWIYVHMIEETARHTGHADILREQIDGVTGVTG
jgi:hypothetical protein